MGKLYNSILALPNNPDKFIIWIVYHDDFIKFIEDYISRVRGKEYLDKYVKVVSRQNSSKYNGKIYFDPMIYDHLGNGQL